MKIKETQTVLGLIEILTDDRPLGPDNTTRANVLLNEMNSGTRDVEYHERLCPVH